MYLNGAGGAPFLYGICDTHPAILMTFCGSLRLSDYLCKAALNASLGVLLALAISLQQIHQKHVIHNNVHPDNILIQDEDGIRVNIVDFGMATFSGQFLHPLEKVDRNKYLHLAPEMLEEGVTSSPAQDVFSVGYIMQTVFYKMGGWPSGTEHLIRALNEDPATRPTLQEIIDTLTEVVDSKASSKKS